MRIEFESGRKKRKATYRDLQRINQEEYTILSRSKLHFIQCSKMDDSPWGYELEYQDGSVRGHYEALGGPISLERIIATFKKYLRGDSSWRHDFTWGKMDPNDWSVDDTTGPPHWIDLRGRTFEAFLKRMLEDCGYVVKMTPESGDQGVDLVVIGNGLRLAVQVKGMAGNVSNRAVQEVVAGMRHYNCASCAVITNSRFTPQARELAKSNDCLLIDRDSLISVQRSRRRSREGANDLGSGSASARFEIESFDEPHRRRHLAETPPREMPSVDVAKVLKGAAKSTGRALELIGDDVIKPMATSLLQVLAWSMVLIVVVILLAVLSLVALCSGLYFSFS